MMTLRYASRLARLIGTCKPEERSLEHPYNSNVLSEKVNHSSRIIHKERLISAASGSSQTPPK